MELTPFERLNKGINDTVNTIEKIEEGLRIHQYHLATLKLAKQFQFPDHSEVEKTYQKFCLTHDDEHKTFMVEQRLANFFGFLFSHSHPQCQWMKISKENNECMINLQLADGLPACTFYIHLTSGVCTAAFTPLVNVMQFTNEDVFKTLLTWIKK